MGINKSCMIQATLPPDDKHPILDKDYESIDYASLFSESKLKRLFCHILGYTTKYNTCNASLLDANRRVVNSGLLELAFMDLIYHYKQSGVMRYIRWPLGGLRWYGCGKHLFTFEAGRRCSRVGVFAFKCKQAHLLNALLVKQVRNLVNLSSSLNRDCFCQQDLLPENVHVCCSAEDSMFDEEFADVLSPSLSEPSISTGLNNDGYEAPINNAVIVPPDRRADYIHFCNISSNESQPSYPLQPPIDVSIMDGNRGVYLVAVPCPISITHGYVNQ